MLGPLQKPSRPLRHILLLTVAPAVVVTLAACAWVLLALGGAVTLTVPIFLGLLGALVASHAVLVAVLARRWAGLSVMDRITMLVGGALVGWYWIPAPIYFLLTMNLDALQFRWTAFAFVWEVPVVGGLFLLTVRRLTRPLQAFLDGPPHADETVAFHRRTLRAPAEIAGLSILFSVLGYTIGALQLRVFASLPAIEQAKNVANGVVVSLLLSVFFYLALDRVLGGVRTEVARRYRVERLPGRTIERRIFGVSLAILLGGLALLTLFVIQASQRIVSETVGARLAADVADLAGRVTHPGEALAATPSGRHGRILVIPPATLGPPDFAPETVRLVADRAAGVAQDSRGELKLVAWAPAPALGAKLVSVALLDDFYAPVVSAAKLMALAGAFVLALGVGILTFASRMIARAILALSAAVRRAEAGEADDRALAIDSADEIEELARAFGRYIRRSQDLQAHLESRVREQTSALAAERHRLGALIEHLPEGVLLLDDENRILVANPAARAALSLVAETTSDGRLVRLGGREALPLAGHAGEAGWQEIVVPGPPERTFETLARRVEPPDAGAAVVVVRDVTNERAMRRETEQQARLAAVGQLAAGIAHDFNNILNAVVNAAALLKRTIAEPAAGERLTLITNQAMRAAKLIRQILDFSRRTTPELQPVDLRVLLGETVTLLERTLPATIRIVTDTAGPHRVNADPTQLSQVLTNLAVNARDAMPTGGTITFRLRTAFPAELPNRAGPATDWVALSVSDTGTGIPAEVQARVFEPFFTTKPPGEGTGLGLSQAYGIVAQHGGQITFTSEPGRGASFTVVLPALADEAPVERAEEAPVPTGRGEMILVAEDDLDVRKTLCDTLVSLEYRVASAETAERAIELYARYADEVRVVVTDLVMPGMGGLGLVRALRGHAEDLPVIVMSGYLGVEARHAPWAEHVHTWLLKPVSAEDLARVIRDVLDRQA